MIPLNKIYCGDCLEVMKEIPDNFIDLVVTSPPYNIGIEYDSWNDRMKWTDYWKFTSEWLSECFRVLKNNGGRICINHYLSFGSGNRGFKIGVKNGTEQEDEDTGNGIRVSPLCEINNIAQNIGFKHHALVVWEDRTLSRKTAWGSWLSASSPYINCPFEGILILFKNKWKKENKGDNTLSSHEFINLTRGLWNLKTENKGLTKANFDLTLPEKCINLLTYKGDIVLDPFVGSGTTAEACIKAQRNFIGIDISPNYCNVANKRLGRLPNTKLEEFA